MKSHILAGTITLLMLTNSVLAADRPSATDSATAFAQLKSLAGDWESKAPTEANPGRGMKWYPEARR
jgi:hypothetical protein